MANVIEYILGLKDQMTPAITNATSHVQKMESALGGVTKMAGMLGVAFGAYQLGSFVKSGVEAYHALEQSQAKVEANIKSTHGAAGVGTEDIVKWTSSLSSHIKASKGEITDMASQLLTFTPITKDVFERSMGMVADIAKQTGHELSETAIMYGKALNDPIDGLQKMQRYGVIFDDTQKKTIAKLQTSGHLIEAQKAMMDAIASSGYEGVATAMFNADPLSRFNKLIGYAKISIGEYVTQILKELMPALENLTGKIKTGVDFLKEHNSVINLVIGSYLTYKALTIVIIGIEKTKVLWQTASKLLTEWQIIAEMKKAGVLTGVTVAQYAYNSALATHSVVATIAAGATALFSAALWSTGIPEIIIAVTLLIGGIVKLTSHFGGFGNAIKATWQMIKAFVSGAANAFEGLGKIILGVLTFNPFMIKEGLDNVMNSVKDASKKIGKIWNHDADSKEFYDNQETKIKHIQDLVEKGKISAGAYYNFVQNATRDIVNATKGGLLDDEKEKSLLSLMPHKMGKTGANGKPGETPKEPKTKAEGQKNINIHVAYNAPLIQGFTISTTNLKEGLQNLKDMVSDILVSATHDSLMVADH